MLVVLLCKRTPVNSDEDVADSAAPRDAAVVPQPAQIGSLASQLRGIGERIAEREPGEDATAEEPPAEANAGEPAEETPTEAPTETAAAVEDPATEDTEKAT